MFRMQFATHCALVLASGAAATVPTPVQAARAPMPPASDMSQDAYKCIVLGQTDVCPKEAESPSYGIKVIREIGPLAARMVREGVQVDAAVAHARTLGETPRLRIVRMVPRKSESVTEHERDERVDSSPGGDEQTLVTVDEP